MKVNLDFLQLINRIEEGHLYTAEEWARSCGATTIGSV